MFIWKFINLINYCICLSVLLQASKGFQNYRHMTNLRVLNDLVDERPIVNLFAEDIFLDDRNLDKFKVYLDEVTTKPYKRLESDGYTVKDFLNVLYCNSKKMKQVTNETNILIYLCGHGNDSVFKFHDREWLCCDDLMASVIWLSQYCSKILLIVDTCQAETMVSRSELPPNVFVVTTSVKDESSISTIHSTYLGISCIDNFVYYLNEVLTELESTALLVELFECVSIKPVGSTLTFSKYKNFTVGEFFN